MKVLKLIFAAVALISVANCTKKNPAAAVDPIKRIQDAIAKNPSYENYISLGLELAKKGQSNEGIAAYQKAIEINPNAPLAYNNICAELNGQRKYADALPSCEKAVAQDPSFVLAKNNLEFAKQKLVETRDSLVQKKKELLAADKKVAPELIDTGMIFFHMKEYDSANELWKAVKKDDALYAMAQNNLASAYIVMNKYDAADRAIKEALSRDPNNQLFQNNKNWLEQKRKEVK